MKAKEIAESLKQYDTFGGTVVVIEDKCIQTDTGGKVVREKDAEDISRSLLGR